MTVEPDMPDLIAPMLAAAGVLPAGAGWSYEFKYDGVRAITYLRDGRVRALSRRGNDVTGSYPELTALAQLLPGRRAILDGEIVALEAGDRPSFARLATRMHVAAPSATLRATVPVVYYVFDVLWLDGRPVLDEPYERRRERLAGLGLDTPGVRTPPHFTGAAGEVVLHAAELGGLEGVVAKRLGAPYRPGKRSADWTKVPLVRTQEVLVAGWKAGAGRRAGTVGSLLLAVHGDDGGLRFAGHVGTGFTDAMLGQLRELLGPLHRGSAPVPDVPREHSRHAHWVEPVLVGEVAFRNWTPDGRLRHPSWRGLRADRGPGSARRHPEPAVPPAGRVEGAFETPDGRWRVEAVRRGRDQFYRLSHGDNVIDGLAIATVQRLLEEAGVDLADLVEAAGPDGPVLNRRGVA
ncbi:non-homologous end-joining DNA ligase [Actinoplanes teichomyceticus]|uniref:non-homologous end-joining DNA ligase n=1 Tax=Actinoplanes teichomyceticus TaxID=1867 RepID=UPI001EF2B677|nr:non-homologous end-joining DNA ligase [Actinoplanes teichomyceticus]